MDNTSKIIKIFTKRVAIELRKKNFKIIGTEPNYKKPQLDVYLFEFSDELIKALSELSNKK